MIVAGPCLWTTLKMEKSILRTAEELKKQEISQMFRVKLWGGGTRKDRYFPGVGAFGIDCLAEINTFIPTITEVQTTNQFDAVRSHLHSVWIGARNSQNYALLDYIATSGERWMVKRGPSMTIQETIDLYDMFEPDYIIERGIVTIDRRDDSRWSPDLKGIIHLKVSRPDIFDKIIVDCSHSAGRKEYVESIYRAFKAIGIKHFMFECTHDGQSETDAGHMLSVAELLKITQEGRNV